MSDTSKTMPVYVRVGHLGTEYQVGTITAASVEEAGAELGALLRTVADTAEREGTLRHAGAGTLASGEDMAAVERNAESGGTQ
jgi:hypothetical protein